jgi:hypothetical protein
MLFDQWFEQGVFGEVFDVVHGQKDIEILGYSDIASSAVALAKAGY